MVIKIWSPNINYRHTKRRSTYVLTRPEVTCCRWLHNDGSFKEYIEKESIKVFGSHREAISYIKKHIGNVYKTSALTNQHPSNDSRYFKVVLYKK